MVTEQDAHDDDDDDDDDNAQEMTPPANPHKGSPALLSVFLNNVPEQSKQIENNCKRFLNNGSNSKPTIKKVPRCTGLNKASPAGTSAHRICMSFAQHVPARSGQASSTAAFFC